MIEIKITAGTAAEALQDLTALTTAMMAQTTAPAPTGKGGAPKTKVKGPTASELAAATPPVDPTNAAPAEEKVEDAAAADTTAPTDNSAASEDAKEETAPEPDKAEKLTLEAIRAAGIEAARKHGKDAIKAILDGLGEAGMASMSPDNYGAFMRKLGELDA